jgi:catechol 2,3-dioxygenase-like lactoylglutathione lyase family enzyme
MQIMESNVTVMVTDMDKAVDFYSGLGMQLKQRWENHYAMLTAPGIVIGLHPAKQTYDSHTNVSIGFMIDDIADAKKLLDTMNVSYESNEDKAGHFISFSDADGTQLYFAQIKWSEVNAQ